MKKAAEEPQVQPLRIKLDPGSRTTGIAIVNDVSGEVVFAAELSHRGSAVKAALESRRAVRRSRRRRQTRYRKARFTNRKRRDGWLAPSLESRISNILTWVKRLGKFCPLTALSMELVKFDTQLMQNPEISGTEYQQGTFNITTKAGKTVQGINHRYCAVFHHCDGYSYGQGTPIPCSKKGTLVSSPRLQALGSPQADC